MPALERFEPWAADWGEVSADHLARYMYATRLVAGKRVLDAGTGYGYGAAILAAHGAASVVGVDQDATAIRKAGETYKAANLTFVEDDCQSLRKLSGSFDVICSFENIEHLANAGDFVRVSAARLDASGVLICSTPDRKSTPAFVNSRPANPFHVNEWYSDEFVSLLSGGYDDVRLCSQVRSWGLELREQAVRNLETFLAVNPAFRMAKWLARLFRRQSYVPPLSGLQSAAIGDYDIHPGQVAHLFGAVLCHVAICTRPKK